MLRKRPIIKLSYISLFLAVSAALLLFLNIPAGASPEYRYTIWQLTRFFALPGLVIVLAAPVLMALRKSRALGIVCLLLIVLVESILFLTIPDSAGAESRYLAGRLLIFPAALALLAALWLMLRAAAGWSTIFAAAGAACLAAPALSPNAYSLHWGFSVLYSVLWAAGALFIGVFCFVQAGRIKNFSAGLLTALGTLFFLWGGAEIFFLVTDQPEDGKYDASGESRHVLAGAAQAGFSMIEKKFGISPRRPDHPSGSSAKLMRRYGKELFDAKYTFDRQGRRIVPVNPEKPLADLLLFGCSFTFGEGLSDEETWAWRLSQDLGPDWQVTNYSFFGYGAQQMLGMLEEKELEPEPKAPMREALFLGIRPHIYRFTGLFFYKFKSLKYKMADGRLERAGYTTDSPLQLIAGLPEIFNGSQAARALSELLISAYVKRHERELLETYAAIITASSRILREAYGARLTALLWGDLDDLAPLLAKENIPTLRVSDFLKMPEDAAAYKIAPGWDLHPNARASAELAAGLSKYYKALLTESRKAAGGDVE